MFSNPPFLGSPRLAECPDVSLALGLPEFRPSVVLTFPTPRPFHQLLALWRPHPHNDFPCCCMTVLVLLLCLRPCERVVGPQRGRDPQAEKGR